MSLAITFDTLKFTKRLEQAGIQPQHAEAIAEAFQSASGEAEVATKRDVERMEAKLEKELAPVRTDLAVVKWMLGVLLASSMAILLKVFLPG